MYPNLEVSTNENASFKLMEEEPLKGKLSPTLLVPYTIAVIAVKNSERMVSL